MKDEKVGLERFVAFRISAEMDARIAALAIARGVKRSPIMREAMAKLLASSDGDGRGENAPREIAHTTS